MGTALAHSRTWRTAAFCALGLSAALAAGVIALALRPAAVPFVIEANQSGEARLVGPATSAYEPSDAQISWHLARFVEMVRGLPSDPIVVRQNWLRAYDWATQGGAQALNAMAEADDPFAKVGNAITLRQALATQREMNVSLATLAKLAVFERSTDSKAAEKLYNLVMEDDADAASALLTSDDKLKGKRPDLPTEWKAYDGFVSKWRDMEPYFTDAKELRPALFLSRDVMAPSYARSGLSVAAKEAIEALLTTTSVNSPAANTAAKALSAGDKRLVMGELVAHLRKEDWIKGPSGVHGAIILAKESNEAESDLKAFLETIPITTMHKATKFALVTAKLISGEK